MQGTLDMEDSDSEEDVSDEWGSVRLTPRLAAHEREPGGSPKSPNSVCGSGDIDGYTHPAEIDPSHLEDGFENIFRALYDNLDCFPMCSGFTDGPCGAMICFKPPMSPEKRKNAHRIIAVSIKRVPELCLGYDDGTDEPNVQIGVSQIGEDTLKKLTHSRGKRVASEWFDSLAAEIAKEELL